MRQLAAGGPDLRQKILIAAGAMAINAVLYLVPNHVQLGTPRLLWWTRIDEGTPLLPQTVWIYFSDYALVSSAFLVSEGWDEVKRFVRAYFVLLVSGAIIHFTWPTVFPREAFPVPGDGPSDRALVALRGVDAATSCMPSMHVAGSYLAAFSLWHISGLSVAAVLAGVFFWIPEFRRKDRAAWAGAPGRDSSAAGARPG